MRCKSSRPGKYFYVCLFVLLFWYYLYLSKKYIIYIKGLGSLIPSALPILKKKIIFQRASKFYNGYKNITKLIYCLQINGFNISKNILYHKQREWLYGQNKENNKIWLLYVNILQKIKKKFLLVTDEFVSIGFGDSCRNTQLWFPTFTRAVVAAVRSWSCRCKTPRCIIIIPFIGIA